MIATRGDAPGEWRPVCIGDILTPVTIRARNVADEDLPVLSMTRHHGLILQSEKFDKRVASRDTANYRVVRRNDIVCGFPMDEGVIYALTRFPIGIVSPAYQVWQVTCEDVDARFLDLLLKSPPLIRIYRGLAANVVERRRSVGKHDFAAIEVKLPSLDEQKKIVGVLQTVQQAKERTEAVIQAARELKKSVLKYLFTYGPVPVDQADGIELKETEIGEIPTGWDVLAMEEALRESVKNGAFVKRERFGGGSPFLNVADTYHRVRVDVRGLERVQATDDELRTYEVQPRDLFYVRSSLKRQGVGQCCMVYSLPESTVFDCHLMRVRVDEDAFIPEFVAYYSISPRGRSELIARSKTTTMTTINQSGLGAFRIPCPPRQVQCQIAELLQSTQRKIEAEQDHKRALEELFNTLLNDLMTAQIRVDDIELGEVDHDEVGR